MATATTPGVLPGVTPSGSTEAVATETTVGSHLLKVDGYSKTKAALAVGESIQSGRFRVGGHSWYIECYPRGEDEECTDWVVVYLCLDHHGASNANDEVKASYKFTLLNRAWKTFLLRAGSTHRQTFSSNLGSRSTAQFVRRKQLESYLVLQDDDCLRISCAVTVTVRDPGSPHGATPVAAAPGASSLGDLLLATQAGRDVTFEVGGEQFMAHSCVLAARSTVSGSLAEFFGPGNENTVGASRHLRVDGVEPRAFGALLHFIYTDSVPDEVLLEADHYHKIAFTCGLLAAADRFGMERLKLICSDMLCGHIDELSAAFTLKLAHKHGCLELKQACIKFLRDLLDSVDQEETS